MDIECPLCKKKQEIDDEDLPDNVVTMLVMSASIASIFLISAGMQHLKEGDL